MTPKGRATTCQAVSVGGRKYVSDNSQCNHCDAGKESDTERDHSLCMPQKPDTAKRQPARIFCHSGRCHCSGADALIRLSHEGIPMWNRYLGCKESRRPSYMSLKASRNSRRESEVAADAVPSGILARVGLATERLGKRRRRSTLRRHGPSSLCRQQR